MTATPHRRCAVSGFGGAVIALSLVGCSVAPSPSARALATGSAAVDASGSAGTPSSRPPTGGLTWTLAGTGDPTASTQYASVAAVADGFVVVGAAGQAGEVAVALHSADGSTWTPDQIAGRGTAPDQVVAWGDRALAVGGGETSRCAHPGSEIDTWVRGSDGVWAEAPFARVLCSGGQTTMPVILAGTPWLAGEGTADIPFLLRSDDGLTWANRSDRLPDEVYLDGAVVDSAGLWLVARTTTEDRALVLVSPDGARFRRMPVDAASGAALSVVGSLAVDGRLVIVASPQDGGPLVRLTAPHGGRWTEAPLTGFPQEDVTGIDATGGPLVAFTGHENGLPKIYASADGAVWHVVPVPAEITIGAWPRSIAVRDGTAVLVGQVEGPAGDGLVGAIWTAPAAILGG